MVFSKLQVYNSVLVAPGVDIRSGGLKVFVNVVLSKLLWFGNLKVLINIILK